jgi:hypothetical protein
VVDVHAAFLNSPFKTHARRILRNLHILLAFARLWQFGGRPRPRACVALMRACSGHHSDWQRGATWRARCSPAWHAGAQVHARRRLQC